MVIRTFACIDFRNYKQLSIEFSPRINIIFGKNGQGKSNLAEAIFFLTHLDSFRTSRLKTLIRRDQLSSFIKSEIIKSDFPINSRIEISTKGRKVWLNDSPVRKLSEYAAQFFSIVFNPDNLHFYRHFPHERRTFFNRSISFMDQNYLEGTRAFRTVHAQKNKLLKNGDLSSLFDWNILFVKKSYDIIIKRREIVEGINKILPKLYTKLTGKQDHLQLEYHPSLKGDINTSLQFLEKVSEREIKLGHALHGPHRDDFKMCLKDGSSEDFFSQGEYRISLLALKLAVNRLMEERVGFLPVLILDDLFSELDSSMRANLQQYLLEIPNQIFITATEPITAFTGPEVRTLEVHDGRIIKGQGERIND